MLLLQHFYRSLEPFSKRNFTIGSELIIFEFWQLCRAKHHFVAHKQWRRNFGVAVWLARMHIKHKLPKSALKSRESFFQNYETRA